MNTSQSLLNHFKNTPESRYYCRLLSTPLEKRSKTDQRLLELLSQRLILLSYSGLVADQSSLQSTES